MRSEVGASAKVGLVTGGGRGIGLGIALRLASEGYTLVISGRRDEAAMHEVLDQVRQASQLPCTCRQMLQTAGSGSRCLRR